MFVVVVLLQRIARAAQVLWVLVTDRATSRRLPWPYLRRRASRDPRMMLQLVGIVSAALVYPASFLLPEPDRGPIIAACAALWLAAVLGPWLLSRLRRSA